MDEHKYQMEVDKHHQKVVESLDLSHIMDYMEQEIKRLEGINEYQTLADINNKLYFAKHLSMAMHELLGKFDEARAATIHTITDEMENLSINWLK